MRRLPVSVLERVQQIKVVAPIPYLRAGRPAQQFNLLRLATYDRTGFDFLGRVDLLRLRGYHSKKPSVSTRSRHICGDAFDFELDSDRYLVVSDVVNDIQYWRVYLKSERGVLRKLKCELRGEVEGRFVDFTTLAESFEYRRIPAWR